MASIGDTVISLGPERRCAFRCNVVDSHLVPVDLAFQSGALMLDLSETGMGVQALVAHPQTGTTTELHFRLPESDVRVDGIGTVTWSDDSGRLGIRFDEIAEMCRPQLAQWLSRERRSQVAPGPARGAPGQDEVALLRRDLLAQKIQGDQALAFVLERVRSVAGATGAAIAIENEGAFICRSSSGAAPSVGASLDPSSGLSGECVRTREVVRCDDTETDSRVDRVVCRALHLRTVVIVPLKTQAGLLGVLEVFSSRPHAFESSNILLLRDTADLIAELVGERMVVAPAALAAATPAPVAAAAAAPAPAVASPLPIAHDTASVTSASPALAPAMAPEWRPMADEPELPSRWLAHHLAAYPRRLKFLVAALAVTMLVGSGWAGWHWGQLISMLHPVPASGAITVPPSATPSIATEGRVSAPSTLVAAPGDPAASPAATLPAPKPVIAPKKNAPVLVLAGSPALSAAAAAEPPPAIAPGVDRGAETAGLAAVLSATAAPASLDRPLLSRGVTGGKLIKRIEPLYPPSARHLRLSGTVVLKASVDVRGRVGTVTVISGSPLLAGAAVNAVKGWRYEPFLLNGVPIANDVTVRVNFAPGD